jgi:predicted metal-dependent peptidase
MADVNDAIAALEQAAQRQEAEEKAYESLHRARAKMLMEPRSAQNRPPSKEDYGRCAFFAHITLNLQTEVNWDIQTTVTDGKKLWYNPDYINGKSDDEVYTCHVHDDLHVVLGHCLPSRIGHRDLAMWNEAADLGTNHLLEEYGFKLPRGAVAPGKGKYVHYEKGLSVEEYYALLEKEAEKMPGQQPGLPGGPGDGEGGGGQGNDQQDNENTESDEGDGDPDDKDDGDKDSNQKGQDEQPKDKPKNVPDPGGMGAVMPSGGNKATPQEKEKAEAEQKMLVAAAAVVAKQRGTLPAGIDALVDELLTPRPDPWEVLREFIDSQANNDYMMPPVDRRLIQQDTFLPDLLSDDLANVTIVWDCSGSLFSADDIQYVAENIMGVLELYPDCELSIIYHDAEVTNVQKWKRNDGIPLKFEPKGGGGTSHKPVFDYLDEHPADSQCVVCITDLYTDFPARQPGYPVLWFCTSPVKEAPFGRVVDLQSSLPSQQ